MLIGVAGKPVARQESQPLWRCMQMGAYHTTELELGRKFTLIKSCWDHIYLERLKIATDPAQDVGFAPTSLVLLHYCSSTFYKNKPHTPHSRLMLQL